MAEPYLTQLQQIVAQIEPRPAEKTTLETKHFFSGAALYANGKICASLSPAGFALKLPQDTRQNLLAERKGTEFRFFPNGPIKQDYVSLSNAVLEDQERFQDLIYLSVRYVDG